MTRSRLSLAFVFVAVAALWESRPRVPEPTTPAELLVGRWRRVHRDLPLPPGHYHEMSFSRTGEYLSGGPPGLRRPTTVWSYRLNGSALDFKYDEAYERWMMFDNRGHWWSVVLSVTRDRLVIGEYNSNEDTAVSIYERFGGSHR